MPPGLQLGAQVGAPSCCAQAPSLGNVGANPIVPPRGRSNNRIGAAKRGRFGPRTFFLVLVFGWIGKRNSGGYRGAIVGVAVVPVAARQTPIARPRASRWK